MNQIREQKNILRKSICQRRDQLSQREITDKSQKITDNLFSLEEFQKASTVMIYSSFKSEVDTTGIINGMKKLGKKIVLPITIFGKNELELKLAEIGEKTKLERNRTGILEPAGKLQHIPLGKIDLLIVPGTAFTKEGKRIGSGRGFFDRLLAKTKAPKVGLAFDLQVVDDMPQESHDHPMDIVVTETKTHRRAAL